MAAVLHDVIEDTEVGPDRLREADLPEDVVATVVALTHRPDESYEQYIEKVACDDLAREVKLADLPITSPTTAGWPAPRMWPPGSTVMSKRSVVCNRRSGGRRRARRPDGAPG